MVRRNPLRLIVCAVATEVRGDDPEAFGEPWYLLAPRVRRLGKTVKQEDERALSFHYAVEADAVDLDVALHRAMLACPMPEGRACQATSRSASGSWPDGLLWLSG
jgi:hypothetical protein